MRNAQIFATFVLVVSAVARIDDHMRWHYEKYNSIYLGVPIMEHISNGVRIFIKNRIAPRNITMKRHANGSITYELLAITDMDREAKVGSKNWTWRAVTRRGQLTLSADKKTVSVEWMKDTDRNITSIRMLCLYVPRIVVCTMNSCPTMSSSSELLFLERLRFDFGPGKTSCRGLLSDLSEFNGHLLAPDDKTGILYEIKGNKAIPWVFLNSGPGNTTDGMKVEWLTIKDDKLYAGGHGCEYRNKTGHIVSEDPMWIKVITKSGQVDSRATLVDLELVRSKNWKSVYRQMLRAAGYREPGYLTHEAVQWSSIQRMWYFLPRKASYTAYNETEDERKGANLLILADNSLREFFVVHVGELDHPERGFSAFDFIPNTDDKLMVALKTEEMHDNPTKSYFTVFTLNGTILLPDQKLDDGYKFEGIYFV